MLNQLKRIFNREKILLANEISYADFCFLKQVYHGKKLKMETSGVSMLPTIKEKEIIEIKVVNSKKVEKLIKKNTIVAFFFQPQGLIAHRVVGINKKGKEIQYQTKGDNIVSNIILISYRDILGVVGLKP